MIQILRKARLHTRLIVTVIAVSVIPLILLACLSYGTFRTSIQNKLIQSACQSAQLANNNVNLLLRNYQHYINVLSVSEAAKNLEQLEAPTGLSTRYAITNQFSRLIRTTPIPDSGLMGVMIVDRNK